MITTETIKDLHLLLIESTAQMERDRNDLRVKISSLDKQIEQRHALIAETSKVVCRRCKGYGEIREWIHQDESRLAACTTCGGTGLAKRGAS